jgi:hypothetical protein
VASKSLLDCTCRQTPANVTKVEIREDEQRIVEYLKDAQKNLDLEIENAGHQMTLDNNRAASGLESSAGRGPSTIKDFSTII